MKRWMRHLPNHAVRRRAVHMIEVAVSMVIVSVILLTAMNMVGAAGQNTRSMTDRGTGHLLAEQLMSEILVQEYNDPDEPTVELGTEGFEGVSKDRSYYDDVDDYDRWNSNPPESKDGATIPDYADWRRQVRVYWVEPADTTLNAVGNTGIKRIVVTVRHDNIVVAELRALRADMGGTE